jgi:type II secretory pathway component PulF
MDLSGGDIFPKFEIIVIIIIIIIIIVVVVVLAAAWPYHWFRYMLCSLP